MNDLTPDQDRKASNLRAALRVARVEAAEQAQAVTALRGAELARLEMLRDAIAPLLAEIPDDADLMFDTGLLPGPTPRLFIDMIAFVEMAPDKRVYRFLQDRRHGRVTLAESPRIEVLHAAIAAYIARRLIEREKALASDAACVVPPPGLARAAAPSTPAAPTGAPEAPAGIPDDLGWAPERQRRGSRLGRIGYWVLCHLGIGSLIVLAVVLLRKILPLVAALWPR